jgi:hypothetical protein
MVPLTLNRVRGRAVYWVKIGTACVSKADLLSAQPFLLDHGKSEVKAGKESDCGNEPEQSSGSFDRSD